MRARDKELYNIPKNIAVIGCAGAIGSDFLNELKQLYEDAILHAFSRENPEKILPHVVYHSMDYCDEDSIAEAARMASEKAFIFFYFG